MRKWLAECHAWLDDPTSVQWEEQVAIGTWHLGSSGFGFYWKDIPTEVEA